MWVSAEHGFYSFTIKLIIYESNLKTNIIIGNILRSFCLILVKESYMDSIKYKNHQIRVKNTELSRTK